MDVKESFQQRFEQALASSDLKPSELAEKKKKKKKNRHIAGYHQPVS